MTTPAIRLIPIDATGQPAAEVGLLPGAARDVCRMAGQLYQSVGYTPPWIAYLATCDGQLVGTCAFKTPPRAGRVEIAYFTFPEFEGRGIATAMARELISIAQRASPPAVVFAQTLPHENASTSVLKKLGFSFRTSLLHPEDGEVWEWELGQPPANGDS